MTIKRDAGTQDYNAAASTPGSYEMFILILTTLALLVAAGLLILPFRPKM